MDDGYSWLPLVKFLGVALLTLGLAAQQIWALKKLALKRREKELAEAAESPQAG